ncbi:MAG TPA: T9SS type A sorting domain-containing protein, partial [Rhodothermales bacterium]|nr:T9SS type A sorting domain-containing protein [Rhodothermales bacterium]
YIGGMQDNGTWRSPDGVSSTASTDWVEQVGGDGFGVAWHAENPDWILGSVQFNQIVRTIDGGSIWQFASEGLGDTGSRGHFITTLAKSQSDPDLVFTTGQNGVWRSDNFGATWTLSRFTEGAGSWDFNGLRAPAAISIADPQIVWAGTEMSGSGKVFVSTDGGLTFNAAPRNNDVDGLLTGLATHPTDPETAYAAFSVPGDPKILRTTNLGATWENLTGTFSNDPLSSNGFPDVATYTVLVMPHNPDEIWAGTEVGLFISTDGGGSWSYADNGLPAAAIWQMRIVDDQVVVATHGRGVWSVTLPELASYTPPVVTRAPRLNTLALAPLGGISLDLTLRSAYDSVAVFVDEERAFSFTTNAAQKDTLIALPLMVTETRNVTASVIAYRDGRAYSSSSSTTTLFPVEEAQVSYVNDLNILAANNDFISNDDEFSVRSENGFSSRAIHSPHDYRDDKNYIDQLRYPILVDDEEAILAYRDVAIIEPGEPGTQFGDPEFWDYVVVEATTDGIMWQPLLDGYDARANADWLAAYEDNEEGFEDMYVEHSIDLLDTFVPGDVIFIRFRLYADANSHGWGWAIDDLAIQEREDTGSANEDGADVPDRFTLAQNYPNPFNPATTIPFTVPRSSPVTIRVYDVQGRLVATVAEGLYPAGTHQVQWNAGSLASGIYFYRLETPDLSLSHSLTLLK